MVDQDVRPSKPDENAVRQVFEQFENFGLIYDSGDREDGWIGYEVRDFGELAREQQAAVLDYLDREPAALWVLGAIFSRIGIEKACAPVRACGTGPI
jgi:hypothetical protein